MNPISLTEARHLADNALKTLGNGPTSPTPPQRHNHYAIYSPDPREIGPGPIIVDLQTGKTTVLGSIPTTWPDWLQHH